MTTATRPDIQVKAIGRPVETPLVKDLVAIAGSPRQPLSETLTSMILTLEAWRNECRSTGYDIDYIIAARGSATIVSAHKKSRLHKSVTFMLHIIRKWQD